MSKCIAENEMLAKLYSKRKHNNMKMQFLKSSFDFFFDILVKLLVFGLLFFYFSFKDFLLFVFSSSVTLSIFHTSVQ